MRDSSVSCAKVAVRCIGSPGLGVTGCGARRMVKVGSLTCEDRAVCISGRHPLVAKPLTRHQGVFRVHLQPVRLQVAVHESPSNPVRCISPQITSRTRLHGTEKAWKGRFNYPQKCSSAFPFFKGHWTFIDHGTQAAGRLKSCQDTPPPCETNSLEARAGKDRRNFHPRDGIAERRPRFSQSFKGRKL
jgi:hypothetical protein